MWRHCLCPTPRMVSGMPFDECFRHSGASLSIRRRVVDLAAPRSGLNQGPGRIMHPLPTITIHIPAATTTTLFTLSTKPSQLYTQHSVFRQRHEKLICAAGRLISLHFLMRPTHCLPRIRSSSSFLGQLESIHRNRTHPPKKIPPMPAAYVVVPNFHISYEMFSERSLEL